MVKKMHAIRVLQTGGPEVMQYEELSVPTPNAGEVLVQVKAAGVNFIDIFLRSGIYSKPLPLTLGFEGAGIVLTVGPGVTQVKPGERVAWTDALGSYATHIIVPSERLVPLPDSISFEQAAAVMLQGLTAHYLTHSTYPLKKNDTCLVHAAAGGVGLLLCQMAKMLGARVIATASTLEKAALAQNSGANKIILYKEQDFAEEVDQLTSGMGVNVIYDSVGKDTYEKSLQSLATRGYLISFGQSSGPLPLIDAKQLAAKSLFFTRPSLFHYIASRAELLSRTNDLFAWITAKKINLHIYQTYPLQEAAAAHNALAERKSTGKLLLIPQS